LARFKFLKKLLRSQPHVAVLTFEGVIGGRGGVGRSQGITMAAMKDAIDRAFALPRLKAVVLCINSPGGSPVQSELLTRYITLKRGKKKIPVLAFIEDVAASGGYWVACAADTIYAASNAIVGSIGVISAGFGVPELLKNYGIERRVYSQGANKSLLDPFLPERKEDVAILLEIQKEVHANFISHVQKARAGKLQEDANLFSGRIWSAKKAMELGLVDGLTDMYSELHERFGDKIRVVSCSKPKGWLSRKLGVEIAALPTACVDAVWAWCEERVLRSRCGG
jgi:signal peptide peptidase SppA